MDILNTSTWTDNTPLIRFINNQPANSNHNISISLEDGQQIVLQKSATHIQWKYVSDTAWQDLIPLVDIKGEQGVRGKTGEQGDKGDAGVADYTYVDSLLNVLKNNLINGKEKVAQAISKKGVETANNAPFATIVTNIGLIDASGAGIPNDRLGVFAPVDNPESQEFLFEVTETTDEQGNLYYIGKYGTPPPLPAEIVFGATVGDNTLHLRNQVGGFDCTIDWGDGSTTVVPVNGGNVVHNYTTAGDYRIKISGKSFAGFYVNYQTGQGNYKELVSMGKWEIDTITSCKDAFKGCISLIKIHTDAFKYVTKITDFSNCFGGCYRLTTMPENLFSNNTAVTDFSHCFNGCSSLTTIPENLFANNTAVTSFSSCFDGCSRLTTIPENLFSNNTAVTDFSHCFRSCYKLTLNNTIFGTDYVNRFLNKSVNFTYCFNRTSFSGTKGTAPELWNFDFGTGKTNELSCFGGKGNSDTSLTNYGNIPAEWI